MDFGVTLKEHEPVWKLDWLAPLMCMFFEVINRVTVQPQSIEVRQGCGRTQKRIIISGSMSSGQIGGLREKPRSRGAVQEWQQKATTKQQ